MHRFAVRSTLLRITEDREIRVTGRARPPFLVARFLFGARPGGHMSPQDGEFLTQRQVSLRYGIHTRTLMRRRHDGRIPTFQDPLNDQVVLYRRADVEALRQIRPEPSKAGAKPGAK